MILLTDMPLTTISLTEKPGALLRRLRTEIGVGKTGCAPFGIWNLPFVNGKDLNDHMGTLTYT